MKEKCKQLFHPLCVKGLVQTMEYDYSVIVEDLLQWFQKNARELPWRGPKNPYYTWVSEIMLQQTRVEAVKEYFLRFVKELPNIQALAEVEEDKLLKLWEGLGYYNRVKNMQKAAIQMMEQYDGKLPADYKELLKLKGIGTYTAGAIASIAYEIPVPAVDGNVLRVAKRLAADYDDIAKPSVKKELEETLKSIMPKGHSGAFNQSLMELGAIVCLPNGAPLCEKCPVQKYCRAYREDVVMELPIKTKKKARTIEEKTVFLIEYQNRYALHQRGQTGLLAGLWELPNIEGRYKEEQVKEFLLQSHLPVVEIQSLGEAKHIFTHKEWHMWGYAVKISSEAVKNTGRNNSFSKLVWAGKEEIKEKYALPSAFHAYRKFLGI